MSLFNPKKEKEKVARPLTEVEVDAVLLEEIVSMTAPFYGDQMTHREVMDKALGRFRYYLDKQLKNGRTFTKNRDHYFRSVLEGSEKAHA